VVGGEILEAPGLLGGEVGLSVGAPDAPAGIRDARGIGNDAEVLADGLAGQFEGVVSEMRSEGGRHPRQDRVVGDDVAPGASLDAADGQDRDLAGRDLAGYDGLQPDDGHGGEPRPRPGDTLASALVWVTPRGRHPGGRTRLGRAARRLPVGPAGACPRAGNPPSPLPAAMAGYR
jgi:hypothetical protein